MFSALLYLHFTSLGNRLIRQFKRLKQPKYLVWAAVGGLYFYFYVFRWMLGSRTRYGQVGPGAFPFDPVLSQSIGGFILMVIVLIAWILPRKRAALTFTEAEVAFLFPAPISRRMLIHFKLMRSQMAILFTTFFLTLIFRRSGGHFWIRMTG